VPEALTGETAQHQETFTAVDLFCGAGGLSEGLRQAGFELVAAADHDPDACATYRLNFPQTAVIEGDLTALERHARLIAAVRSRTANLDLLAGGPPCQAFSQVRNHDRLLKDPRNRLYREFVQILAELRPRALLVENVPGMIQLQDGAVRREIEAELSLDGEYDVHSTVLDAGDHGTPQSRPRLVFVGVRRGETMPSWPTGTAVTKSLRLRAEGDKREPRYRLDGEGDNPEIANRLLDPEDLSAVTVEQALGDLLEPGERYSLDPRSAYQRQMREGCEGPDDHIPSRIREDTVIRLKSIPPGGNIYDLPDRLLKRYVTNTKWGPAGNGKRLSRKHFYAYRRLHPDWLAWTANTKADFAYHYCLARGLSAREVARLQGLPDRFHVITAPPGTPGQLYGGARHSRYRQIGNAVPPPLAHAAGAQIRVALEAGVDQPGWAPRREAA
jgi:DNA (cytosine-5)-methyltransferase 1